MVRKRSVEAVSLGGGDNRPWRRRPGARGNLDCSGRLPDAGGPLREVEARPEARSEAAEPGPVRPWSSERDVAVVPPRLS